jgi:hypothetical protein
MNYKKSMMILGFTGLPISCGLDATTSSIAVKEDCLGIYEAYSSDANSATRTGLAGGATGTSRYVYFKAGTYGVDTEEAAVVRLDAVGAEQYRTFRKPQTDRLPLYRCDRTTGRITGADVEPGSQELWEGEWSSIEDGAPHLGGR